MGRSGKTKKQNKREAKKRAIRTTNKDTKQDGMCAARRKYGLGQGR